MGGSKASAAVRRPAHAYFVPLLSGLQLFASVQMADVPDPPPAGGERLYACDQGRLPPVSHSVTNAVVQLLQPLQCRRPTGHTTTTESHDLAAACSTRACHTSPPATGHGSAGC